MNRAIRAWAKRAGRLVPAGAAWRGGVRHSASGPALIWLPAGPGRLSLFRVPPATHRPCTIPALPPGLSKGTSYFSGLSTNELQRRSYSFLLRYDCLLSELTEARRLRVSELTEARRLQVTPFIPWL